MLYNPKIFNLLLKRIQPALDPSNIVGQNLDLANFSSSHKGKYAAIAVGKGSSAILKSIFDKYFPARSYISLDNFKYSKNLNVLICDHPLPSLKNIRHSEQIINFLKKTGDLPILSVITGGSSAMLTKPVNLLSKAREVSQQIINSGLSIEKVNTVRKHSDYLKGGNLSKIIYPRPSCNFYISDVDRDDLSLIGSGPTVYDSTTKEDAMEILETLNIDDFNLVETPKDSKYFVSTKNNLLYSRSMMLTSLSNFADGNNYFSNNDLSGESHDVIEKIYSKIGHIYDSYFFTGETSMNIKSGGKGGRCSHLALMLLLKLKDYHSYDIVSLATDGLDNSEYAGVAFNNKELYSLTNDKEVNKYLSEFNSYDFFNKYHCAIKTGPMPINLSDLLIIRRR
jgi:glycerate-2-kinase